MQHPSRSGGAILIDQLIAQGVRRLFCVPGESYLAALDALHQRADRIATVVCRHEGGAAFMAEAHGKLTGEVGVCFVTRGPGASNAAIGVHTAMQDSTPMLLLIGQVPRRMKHREAFQEFDIDRLYGWTTKWAAEVTDPARLPELVVRALRLAVTGRPGPVALALPEDVLSGMAAVADLPPLARTRQAPAPAAMTELAARLTAARQPLAIIGGGGWTPQACGDFARFARHWDLPVASTLRRQDLIDNDLAVYCGDLALAPDPRLLARVKAADLILAVGTRLSEAATQGYSLLAVPAPQMPLIHVHPDALEIGRVYQPALGLAADMAEFAAAAAALPAPPAAPWSAWRQAARADYEASQEPDPCPGPLDMVAVMAVLRRRLPADTIVTNDAGAFTGWPHRYWRFRVPRSQLGPVNGAMGYGVPAAIAAALEAPGRRVLCWVGDGGLLMTGNELATALRHGAAPLILVVDNGIYGTIRLHQERSYPGRVAATDLTNPDFAAYARAFGAHGATVATTAAFEPALDDALAAVDSGRPALLCLKLDPEVITTRTTLAQIRAKALAARATGP